MLPSEPAPLFSNDGLFPVQQIGLIAQKNLPTCVGRKKRKTEHDQNTPVNQYSLQRWKLVILPDVNENDGQDKTRGGFGIGLHSSTAQVNIPFIQPLIQLLIHSILQHTGREGEIKVAR